MSKGLSGAFIAVGFFGILFWWFASGAFYTVFTAAGMDVFMSSLIVILPFAFFLGMLLYGFVKSGN